MPPTIDLDDLGLDAAGTSCWQRALASLSRRRLEVGGRDPHLAVHLGRGAAARDIGRRRHARSSRAPPADDRVARAGRGRVATVRRRAAPTMGARGAGRAGRRGRAAPRWAIDLDATSCGPTSCRGSMPGRGRRSGIPRPAVDWSAPFDLPDEVEAAVVQVMTYLVENEQAALTVPARFLVASIPTFVKSCNCSPFRSPTRPATSRYSPAGRRSAAADGRLRRRWAGLPADVAGRARLHAGGLLAVGAGRGNVPDLLAFLERYAPDPVTAQVARLALRTRRDTSRSASAIPLMP